MSLSLLFNAWASLLLHFSDTILLLLLKNVMLQRVGQTDGGNKGGQSEIVLFEWGDKNMIPSQIDTVQTVCS